MGFYIQDDYYEKAVKRLKPRQQELFWAALIRYYFEPGFNVDDAGLCDLALGIFEGAQSRLDKSKKASNENKAKRNVEQQNEKRCRNVAQQNEKRCQNVAQQNENYPSKNQESESESESESENTLRNSPVVVGFNRPDRAAAEIETTPPEFPAFMAGCVKAFNEATGQAYAYPTAKARDGMLRVFHSGRSLDDVGEVMADVATWNKRYQTLEAVFADGKFEKHMNRPKGGNDYAYLDALPNA